MKNFKDLGISVITKGFTGDKIKLNKILNKQIIVHDFKVSDSKFENSGKCLNLQIEVDGEKRVVFTRGSVLIKMLELANKNDFPFKATIVRDNDNGPFEFR